MPPSPLRYTPRTRSLERRPAYQITFANSKQIRHRRSLYDPFRTGCNRDLIYSGKWKVNKDLDVPSCIDCKRLTGDQFVNTGGTPLILTSVQINEIVKLYVEYELSAAEIASQFFVSRTTVLNYLRSRGVELRSKNWRRQKLPPQQEVKIITHLYWERKLTVGEVGKVFGISPTSMNQRMIKYGIPRRTRARQQQLRFERATA